ncbi:MAG: MFS transporter [Actinomycetota bacterium]
MSGPSTSPDTAGRVSRAVRTRMYAMAWVDEFGPLYALYTLWFNDNGITTAQISIVFLVWAAVAIVLEIPSGAVADLMDRRVLLAAAFVLRAVGIGIWLVFPTFAGALVGALLWATHSALASGTWEALIHDELEELGEASTYATVLARMEQFSDLGIAAGTVAAFGLLRVGASILALGWFTVALHAITIALVLSLPAVDRRGANGPAETVGQAVTDWWRTLTDGVREAAGNAVVARLVVLGAFVEGLFVFDEYVPLLGRDRGAADSIVPFLVLVVWVGRLIGSELVARRPDLGRAPVSAMLVVGVGAMFAGLLADSIVALALIGFGYFALQALWLISGARLQEQLSPERRATVTSIRGFGGGVVNTAAFLLIAVMANGDDPQPGLLIALGALLTVAVAARFLLPARSVLTTEANPT